MIRRALLLLALVGVYLAYKQSKHAAGAAASDQEEDARWANEGGANAPPFV